MPVITPSLPRPGENTVRILHEDAWLLLVEKPAGLLSVPGRLPQNRDSVALRVHAMYPEALIVHRLDQVTSGLLLMARDPATHRALSEAFAARKIDKRYEALVEGVIEDDAGEIDLPLICDWPNRPRQKVDHDAGKPSRTRWRVMSRDEATSSTRLELEPLTGRSHQLRVHLAEIGHPIQGDAFYGAASAARVCLHATRLAFNHPSTGRRVEFSSSPPF
ncbi:MAG: RluA family pseudouridine synthase [Xanthomonadaceae bacterium]|nr:RluA family pseudouridine synthase [Xanthomonadaceae bacterium]